MWKPSWRPFWSHHGVFGRPLGGPKDAAIYDATSTEGLGRLQQSERKVLEDRHLPSLRTYFIIWHWLTSLTLNQRLQREPWQCQFTQCSADPDLWLPLRVTEQLGANLGQLTNLLLGQSAPVTRFFASRIEVFGPFGDRLTKTLTALQARAFPPHMMCSGCDCLEQ